MAIKHFDGSDRAPQPDMRDLARGAFVEFIAMCLFVYFGCGSAASNATKISGGAWPEWDSASVTIIAFQFGLGITVLAFATAHTSGGRALTVFNPVTSCPVPVPFPRPRSQRPVLTDINCAVTLALTIVGSCHPIRALAYLVAQMVGSIVGAALLFATTDGGIDEGGIDRTGGLGSNGRQNPNVTIGNAVLAEVMGTALLCFVVLEVAVNVQAVTTDGEQMVQGNKQNLAPIPIGLAVFMAHVLCIPITGCSINPTRSFGPAVVSNTWTDHWIWWVGPLTGAVLASFVWGILKKLADPATDDPGTAPQTTKTYSDTKADTVTETA